MPVSTSRTFQTELLFVSHRRDGQSVTVAFPHREIGVTLWHLAPNISCLSQWAFQGAQFDKTVADDQGQWWTVNGQRSLVSER